MFDPTQYYEVLCSIPWAQFFFSICTEWLVAMRFYVQSPVTIKIFTDNLDPFFTNNLDCFQILKL
jgi:hypothetical protein